MRVGPVSPVSVAGIASLLVVVACAAPYGDAGSGTDQASAASTNKDQTNPTPTPAAPPPALTPVQGGGGGAGSGAGGASSSSGGASDGGVDAAPADPSACPAKDAAVSAWKAAPATSAACSSADITYFAQSAATQTWLGIESLMHTRNANCAKCVFSHDSDATWRPVLYVGASGDALVNYGACFERAPGGSEACGRAVYQWSDCYAKVCDSTACGSQAAIDACYNSAGAATACAAYDPTTPCGGATAYAAINNSCYSYVDVARVLCSSGN